MDRITVIVVACLLTGCTSKVRSRTNQQQPSEHAGRTSAPTEASTTNMGLSPQTDSTISANVSDSENSPEAIFACQQFADAICPRLAACAPAPFRVMYGQTERCRSRMGSSCAAVFARQGVKPNAGMIEACTRGLGMASCDQVVLSMLPKACRAMLTTRKLGDACTSDEECLDGLCSGDDQSSRHCTLAPVGTFCYTDGDCSSGNVCGPGGRCGALRGLGMPCDLNHPCLPLLSCVGLDDDRNGVCQGPLPLGAHCDPLRQTTPGCDAMHGGYCHPYKHTCEEMRWADGGAPCGADEQTGEVLLCSAGATCHKQGDLATCVPPAADGAPCDVEAGPDCLMPAQCIAGRCRLNSSSWQSSSPNAHH